MSPIKTDPDASLSLLGRLVDDAMDPGYQEATDRGDRRGADWRHSIAFAAVITVTAALVAATVLQVRDGAPETSQARADLTERVIAATAAVEQIDARIDTLKVEADQLRQTALDGSGPDRALAAQVATLEAQTGVAAVDGPGVEVVVDDGPPAVVAEGGPDLARVLDSDIQLIVNGLFASGAEAVAVNGQRITALSPIRSAGEAILVGFRPLTPPYTITGVGPAGLSDAFGSSAARGVLTDLESTYGIALEVIPSEDLSVPGRGDLQLRYVTKGEGP